jgi:hypothetical protein
LKQQSAEPKRKIDAAKKANNMLIHLQLGIPDFERRAGHGSRDVKGRLTTSSLPRLPAASSSRGRS